MRLPSEPRGLSGMNVTIMGLGLNGGGLACSQFLIDHGARVTITDLRDEATLRPSLEALGGRSFRTVLGTHELADFASADFIIKNPAVRPGNPYVAAAASVETDLSLFFAYAANPVLAITGSKGKSSTASALAHCLRLAYPGCRLGGNITVSPLSFLHELAPEDPVVLELSSFQLGDLYLCSSFRAGQLRSFPPAIGILTNIFRDHQDYYGAMEPYVADKVKLFATQGSRQQALLFEEDAWTPRILPDCPGNLRLLSAGGRTERSAGWLEPAGGPSADPFAGVTGSMLWNGREELIVPETLALAGQHHRKNLLAAGVAAVLFGMPPAQVRAGVASFAGVEHRLETVAVHQGVVYVNDSAATIPDAVSAGVASLGRNIHLIAGGTDKKLDFTAFKDIRPQVKTLRLLKGTASDAIDLVLRQAGQDHQGIYDNLVRCLDDAIQDARPGDTILLSPGCASFGLFLNEFDRGRQFKAAVRASLGHG